MSYTEFHRQHCDEDLNIQNYNYCKFTLETLIHNNIKTVFLIGSGSNGKTHLLNECREKIISNDYNTYDNPDFLINIQDGTELLTMLSMMANKKIISFCYNPFIHFNVEKPENVVIIDMNHIMF